MPQTFKTTPPKTTGEWRTSPEVHFVEIGDDLVFLHLGYDRYVCLPDGARDVSQAPSGALLIGDAALASDLAAAGLIVAADDAISCRQRRNLEMPVAPTRTASPERTGRLRAADVPLLTLFALEVASFYRSRSLGDLIARARRGRPVGDRSFSAALAPVARRFHRVWPYAPAPSKCLVRSFLLLRLLHRCGFDATWVFGVTTWPFRAHCWLQAGEVVLDDEVERVRAFTPLLAV